MPTRTPRRTTAIVVGASMAGLVAARVLSDHADHVLVLERDRLSTGAQTRPSVRQGRHAHALLSSGQRLLEGWFPGLSEDLYVRGAVPLHAGDLAVHGAGADRVRAGLGYLAMSASRPLLETTVREHLVRQRRNVTITDDVTIDEPIVEHDRVVGVRADGVVHRADLVVDCSGRRAGFLDQLHVAGFPAPEVSTVRLARTASTRVLARRPDDLDGTTAVLVDDPASGRRTGTLLPIEDDRWILTVTSGGDDAPTDSAGFAAAVRSLPSTDLAAVLERAEPLTPVLTHRVPASHRLHVERLEHPPAGFVVLGDAVASFDPVHGLGMASAARQAEALARSLSRHDLGSRRLVRSAYRRVARAVDAPWAIATRAADDAPAGSWAERVALASHTSQRVADRLLEVQHLEARPASLLTPGMVARVLVAAPRSPVVRSRRATARPATTPRVIGSHGNVDARMLTR